jgi:hypothetical protein
MTRDVAPAGIRSTNAAGSGRVQRTAIIPAIVMVVPGPP